MRVIGTFRKEREIVIETVREIVIETVREIVIEMGCVRERER